MRNKKIVLVTGPPGNSRDEYIKKAVENYKWIFKKENGEEVELKVGYYHVFEYMQKLAPTRNVPNLLRDNVFDISKATLERIRNDAFEKISEEIKKFSK